jgi:histidinol-phosphate/aromatic aminotransferase/cobyric acid decarboxylase-like protein/GNAT superfamily N-acetyltransferase
MKLRIALASEDDRAAIFRLRHAVYACELGQHPQNETGLLQDELDEFNTSIVAMDGDGLAGFVSITPPGRRYSIDKYLDRSALPFPLDGSAFEVRLLTVADGYRHRGVAPLLMYAACRWVDAAGGRRIVALGRHEVLPLYLKAGLEPTGQLVQAGAVRYHVLHGELDKLRAAAAARRELTRTLARRMEWQLPVALEPAPSCYHGGAFFEEVGDAFDDLSRRHGIINADVLDAWFPPSPRVLAELEQHLPWLVQTSPPTECAGLVRAIAAARGVAVEQLVVGAGSSDLIFRALPRWLSRDSRVLILDPMYGEYAHILERVIGCRVDRLRLHRADDYDIDVERLARRVARGSYDMVVLVNPNSPTGRHLPRAALASLIARVPQRTRVWVDETYIDYAGVAESVESLAAVHPNVVVCKSMSKAYALSGARVAYLCAAPAAAAELRAWTPPWAVGLPAQVAAVRALQDRDYYRARWEETHALRSELGRTLQDSLGWDVVPGTANFLLCHLPAAGPRAATLVAAARRSGLFLRDVGNMGATLGDRAIRIAVKDSVTNQRVLEILRRAPPR